MTDESLLKGKKLIGFYCSKKVKLTNYRLLYKDISAGGYQIQSVFLDQISLVQSKYQRFFELIVVGITLMILGLIIPLEDEFFKPILFITGVVLIIIFFFINNYKLTIYTTGSGVIKIPPFAIEKKNRIEFLHTLDQAILDYKTKANSIDDGNKPFKKEDFY